MWIALLLMFLLRSVQAFRATPSHLLWRRERIWWHGAPTQVPWQMRPSRPYTTSIVRNALATDGLGMENLYTEWTLRQDQLLWEHHGRETVAQLAARLGRGLRGTEQRLAKLKDVNSAAYQRLFVQNGTVKSLTDKEEESQETKKKLVPSSEVLRRIQWDSTLSAEDFSVIHYDRVEDTLVETPVDAPNCSISGKATRFIDALPEHRIVAIKYRERLVWDREQRLDCVFGGEGEGIAEVIRGYDEWKRAKDEEEERNLQRRLHVTSTLQQLLGVDGLDQLNALWENLTAKAAKDPALSMKLEAEKYVRRALALLKNTEGKSEQQPLSDLASLELLSEYMVLYEESKLRSFILDELYLCMLKAEGKLTVPLPRDRKLPELNEKDLTETFIRGTGPGGQKINKTSNRVVLVHEPTQLRVECQETRSLPQNRKIARKRLQEKLDEYLNGSLSKANLKAQKLSSKKAKAKYRSRARMQEKKGSTQLEDSDNDDDES